MTTGISAVLPEEFGVRFQGRRCSGAVSSTIPAFYTKVVTLASIEPDYDGSPGRKYFHDTALALFAGGGSTPTNQSALDNLATQIATDFINWHKVSFDEVFSSIISPNIDALTDTLEFDYRPDHFGTRRYSSPFNGDPEEMMHNDGPHNAACVDVGTTTIVQKTPCLEFYAPPATCVSGKPNLTRYKVCFIDGIFIQTYVSTDVVT